MKTDLDRRRTSLLLSLALISWLTMESAQAADHPREASTPFQDGPKPIVEVESSLQPSAPVVEGAPARATWVDDIVNALGSYFKTNYPTDDFTPYRQKLTLVQDALARGDRRTVKAEMGAFFQLLADGSHGISERAAEELTNFAQMVMAVQEHGIVFPRRESEEHGATGPRTEGTTEREETPSGGKRQESSYVD
jgi:hypothetical protein